MPLLQAEDGVRGKAADGIQLVVNLKPVLMIVTNVPVSDVVASGTVMRVGPDLLLLAVVTCLLVAVALLKTALGMATLVLPRRKLLVMASTDPAPSEEIESKRLTTTMVHVGMTFDVLFMMDDFIGNLHSVLATRGRRGYIRWK